MGNGYLDRVSPITDRQLLQGQIKLGQIQIMISAVLLYKWTNWKNLFDLRLFIQFSDSAFDNTWNRLYKYNHLPVVWSTKDMTFVRYQRQQKRAERFHKDNSDF